jgi:hypothetical protein
VPPLFRGSFAPTVRLIGVGSHRSFDEAVRTAVVRFSVEATMEAWRRWFLGNRRELSPGGPISAQPQRGALQVLVGLVGGREIGSRLLV